MGALVDLPWVSSIVVFNVTTITTSMAMVAFLFVSDYWAFCTVSVIYGFSMSCVRWDSSQRVPRSFVIRLCNSKWNSMEMAALLHQKKYCLMIFQFSNQRCVSWAFWNRCLELDFRTALFFSWCSVLSGVASGRSCLRSVWISKSHLHTRSCRAPLIR